METTKVKEHADTIVEQPEIKPVRPSRSKEPGNAARTQTRRSSYPARAIISVSLMIFAIAIFVVARGLRTTPDSPSVVAEASSADDANSMTLDDSQMRSIKLALATTQAFRAEKVATGKIAFNEEFVTPVFSAYAGRVIRLLAKPGDFIRQGSPLLEIDTPDLVQAESDLITAGMSLAKSNAALELARRAEDRQHRLYANKAVALKDWEQAESDVKSAERDLHSAEAASAAARSRLRVFGKTDQEIARIETERQLDRLTKVTSPIAGTITARKVGPGQYVKPDSPDPLFTVADLSTVWILADVYESDVPLLKAGQPVEVRVSAYPTEVFSARISYISPTVDPTTHRIGVRGVIENRGQRLKPEMFAGFRIVTNSEIQSLAVPLSAIIREGGGAVVWVAQGGNQFVRRDVTLGMQQDGYAQIISGLEPGEKVAIEGGLLLANAAISKD